MAITLEANYSKKLGLPGYSSHQYMITLRTELADLGQVEAESARLIAHQYGARSLVYLPQQVAAQVCKRPADFVRAAKRYCEPELNF